ncbi:hypothetical protein DH2020_000221 [Rehmannia glutinosa]|uniref:Helicase protein MOM1 n=1 Tax=Rehmannia glutinosa TaxID=99300 RepID=A0ABR0XVV8_REHGL
MIASSQTMQNSQCLEIGKPPSTPPVKWKSEKLEKHNALKRSDRNKENLPSSYSGPKQCAKGLTLETMKSERTEVHQESVGMKRKKLTGHSFKSRFQKKCINEAVPDFDGKMEVSDKLSHVCCDIYRGIGSEPFAKLVNPPAVDGLEDSRATSVFREIFNDSERLPTNFSPTKNKDAPEPETSINLECVAETTPRSAECENCIVGTCIICSKEKRISYSSKEKELCCCDATAEKDLNRSSTCTDTVDHGAAVTFVSAEKCHLRTLLKETHSDCQMDGHGTVCAVCNNDGELLCCEGKHCKRRYHPSCLDPPLPDVLPGIWHCAKCVNKKLELGVYSVSEGVESIWDVREVEVSKAKGIRQRQYLVKYHGLAHIHNHWVPEKQLFLENQSIVSSFISKDKTARWSAEWTVPHRLLRKRPILHKFHTASSADVSESYEWLVKWQGLDYDRATWELDRSYFLSSSLGQNLMTEYETRREKAKKEIDECQKGSLVELSELPASGLNVNDNLLLKNVNKLRECWYKCQNTVIFDNQGQGAQDRTMTLVFFIQSLNEICHPFLIVAASDSLSQWEAEFARLAPSVDVVVYSGNIDNRKGIRASEFYEEGGCVMLQVLLSSPEAVFEDLDMLSCIRWQSIVIDEYQHSGVSIDVEQIKILTTDLRILLVSGQIKDTTSEYLNILSLLDSHHDFNKLKSLKSRKNENTGKLKERVSRFIAYGSTSEVSKFLEYWVPVQISNHQLEQYCATLISNSILLCSCSRNDGLGTLGPSRIFFLQFDSFEYLVLLQCCDHPYLVDSSVQECMVAEGRHAAELLDVGIKASGKLQLLDMMLTQIQARGLQVVVLFQSLLGPGRISTGNILDDFLRQRFGPNTFERVDAGVSPARRQTAVNGFNKKETGQFILLLENRACSSSIRLSSLDVIVLYDGDWNPANDFRALQKISIDLAVNQIKQIRRDYHAERSSDLNSISGQLLLNEITEEFQSILSESSEISDRSPVISKAKLDVGSYSTDVPMLGEAKLQLKNVEEPHVFWRNLLDRRSPRWKHIRGQCPRNRKRVQYLVGLLGTSDTENDDVGKKRRSAVKEGGPSSPNHMSGLSSFSPEVDKCGAEERNASSDEQKSLHNSLQEETGRLCQILKLSEDITRMLKRFLEYVILNHHICRDSQATMQAFQISLCWIAASISKQQVDETESLMLAKQFLNYQCTEEQVHSVYSKLQHLKRMYLQCSLTTTDLGSDCLLAEENIQKETFNIDEGSSPSSLVKLSNAKMKIDENSANEEHYEGQILLQQKQAVRDKGDLSETSTSIASFPKHSFLDNTINEIQKNCDKRMKKLIRKQQQETQEFCRIWEEKKIKLEKDHKLKAAMIRCIYGEGSARVDRLKMLDDEFAKKTEENNLLQDVQFKDLEAKQLAARDKEREKAAGWMAKAKACKPQSLGLPSVEDVVPLTRQHEDNNPSKGECVQGNYVAPSDTSVSNAPIGTPINLVSINPQIEVGLTFSERSILVEQINQPNLTGEIICANLPVTGENVPDEMGSVELNKEVPSEVPETVPYGFVDYVNTEKMISASNKEYDKGDTIDLPGGLVNHRDGTDENPSGDLPLARQISEASEQTEASPHHRDLLPLQVCASSLAMLLQSIAYVSFSKVPNATLYGIDILSISSPFFRGFYMHTGFFCIFLEDFVSNAAGISSKIMMQVPEDQIHRSLCAELQDQGAQAVEEQNTLQFEVAASEFVDSVTALQSSSKLQDRRTPVVESQSNIEVATLDGIDSVTPEQSGTLSHDAPLVEDQGTLQIEVTNSTQVGTVTPLQSSADAQAIENFVSIDVSPRENQSTATEVETQRHDLPINSSRTVEGAETEVLSHESASGIVGNLEMPNNNIDIGSVSRIAHETNVELSTHSQNDVAMSQAVVGTVELPNQDVRQLEIDVGHLRRSNYLFSHPNHQVTSRHLFAEPLQNELETICKETKQLEKRHEEMVGLSEYFLDNILFHDSALLITVSFLFKQMTRLKSDCEKEIQEMIAQIRNKYEVKLQDAEAEFILKKNGLHENRNKVVMNKLLAEAFSSVCVKVSSVPPKFSKHLRHLSPQHSVRRSPGATNLQAFRPSANLHSGPQIRAPPPHIQAFTPSAASFRLPSIPQHRLQQLLLSQHLQSAQQPPSTSHNRHENQGGPPPLWGPTLPPLELLTADVDRRPREDIAHRLTDSETTKFLVRLIAPELRYHGCLYDGPLLLFCDMFGLYGEINQW